VVIGCMCTGILAFAPVGKFCWWINSCGRENIVADLAFHELCVIMVFV
jgi:hypothetical protein